MPELLREDAPGDGTQLALSRSRWIWKSNVIYRVHLAQAVNSNDSDGESRTNHTRKR